jgi:hypothetical protein
MYAPPPGPPPSSNGLAPANPGAISGGLFPSPTGSSFLPGTSSNGLWQPNLNRLAQISPTPSPISSTASEVGALNASSVSVPPSAPPNAPLPPSASSPPTVSPSSAPDHSRIHSTGERMGGRIFVDDVDEPPAYTRTADPYSETSLESGPSRPFRPAPPPRQPPPLPPRPGAQNPPHGPPLSHRPRPSSDFARDFYAAGEGDPSMFSDNPTASDGRRRDGGVQVDGSPTTIPTPGRPLLKDGRLLLYPFDYRCPKCTCSLSFNFYRLCLSTILRFCLILLLVT